MTALATQSTAPAPLRETRMTPTREYTFEELREIARAFAGSKFFRDAAVPEAAFAKIIAGQELGLPPMQAMTQIMMVDGKPTLAAPNVGALVKRSGRYDYRVVALTNTVCTLEFFERGQPVGESTFTIEDAKTAGLAGKDVWKKYTRNMLFSRAMTNGARWYAAEAFNGAIYTPEELGAEVDVMPDGEMRLVGAASLPDSIAAPPAPANPSSFEAGSPFAESVFAAQDEPAKPADLGPVPTTDDLVALFREARLDPLQYGRLGPWLVDHIARDLQGRKPMELTDAEARHAATLLKEITSARVAEAEASPPPEAQELEFELGAGETIDDNEPVIDEPPATPPTVATAAPPPVQQIDENAAATRSQKTQIALRRATLIDKQGWAMDNYRACMKETMDKESAAKFTQGEAAEFIVILDHILADKQEPWPVRNVQGAD